MRLMVAGGGTGGHVFPGAALAEEVVTRHPQNDVVFVGTARGLEAKVVPAAGYPIELIEVKGLKGKGVLAMLESILLLPLAFVQCWRILRRWRPDLVVGVGGYASGPVVLTAWLMRIPTAVQEQNAMPGFTNRVLGWFVKAAFTAFPEAGGFFAERKVHQLGNPIRRELMDNYMRPSQVHDKLRLLVFGGSQGAHALNMRVIEALPHLVDLRDRLEITHQTGARDRSTVDKGYRACGFPVDVREFITDMSDAYARSDLVVCRAGATTLADAFEITDAEGRIEYANNAHAVLTGYPLFEVLGESITRFVDDETARIDLERAISCGESWHHEIECKRKEGHPLLVKCSWHLSYQEKYLVRLLLRIWYDEGGTMHPPLA